MYTIGELSQRTGVSRRAIRLYEEKGLIDPSYRGQNGYRYYLEKQVDVLNEIKSLKSLGFSLEEMRTLVGLKKESFKCDLERKLTEVKKEIQLLKLREDEISQLLSVTKKIKHGTKISFEERRIFMDAIREKIINSLNIRAGSVSDKHLDFIERDKGFFDTKEKQEFLEVVKECVEFARNKNLILGPGRGSSPSSITLYGLGFSGVDPTNKNLLPERFIKDEPDLHIDVQFEGGQEFVDFCRERSKKLKYGQINAFKMPLLNIIQNVEKRLDKGVDYESISDDSEIVLNNIRKGFIEKIFCMDMSEDALVMKYENFYPEYRTTEKLEEYLKTQHIYSFLDVLNIIALWRPNRQELISRMERYKEAKEKDLSYGFLSPTLKEYLKPNFGQIIYHEDIIRILKEYTDWDLTRCGIFRRDLFKGKACEADLKSLEEQAPRDVYSLILSESKWTFCKSHIMAFAQLIKKTAVLQSLHQDIYFDEITKWEKKFGFKWDDIGIKLKGVSILQH